MINGLDLITNPITCLLGNIFNKIIESITFVKFQIKTELFCI
jgi:hypothetical protein